MQTVQMTLDEQLVRAVDRLAAKLGTNRSAFTRDALRKALEKHRLNALEEKHRKGYLNKPVKKGEFDSWEDEQAWGDA